LNILITGGYGFLGSHIAEKFINKGHKIIIIDNGTDTSPFKVESKHRSINMDVTDPGCTKVFESSRIDVVLHLARTRTDKYTGKENEVRDDANITGLANMLTLSQKTGVKKFIIVLCSSIYGNPGSQEVLPFSEIDTPEPVNPSGMNNYVKEYYTRKWSELYSLDVLCIRAANIYGPGEKKDNGVIPIFINNIINNEKIRINGYGTQTRDFIFIDDFTDAVFKAALDEECTGILNISTNESHSISMLADKLSEKYKAKRIEYLNNYTITVGQSRLDNARIKKMGWKPKTSLEQGLEKTFDWHKLQSEKPEARKNPLINLERFIKRFPKRILAYIENIILFSIAALMQYGHLYWSFLSSDIIFDYSLVYIAVMGILWGQRQAYLAMIMATGLYIGTTIMSGTDLITFIYTPEHLLRMAIYVLIGVVTGYSVEKKNRDLASSQASLESLTKKYEFLNEIYNETRVVKNELQDRIVETEDSFGVIYSIVQEVNSLEIEKVFSASIDAIERIMKTGSVSIYTVSDNENTKFMRLKTRSQALDGIIPNSIELKEYPVLLEVINSKSLVVNHDLSKTLPLLMAPVIDGNKVIAVISLHKVPFERLTMHYENLFQTVVSLISNALKRAYFFEASLRDKRYLPDTRILNSDTFEKILDEVRAKETELGMSYSLLHVKTDPSPDLKRLSDSLIHGIRDNDYIGISKHEKIYILLSNTAHNHANLVVKRLQNQGIESSIVTGAEDEL